MFVAFRAHFFTSTAGKRWSTSTSTTTSTRAGLELLTDDTMEAASASEAQLLITGAGGDQPLIMSAEDAAQFLAQAGLQLADIGDSERIIIGDAGQSHQEVKRLN